MARLASPRSARASSLSALKDPVIVVSGVRSSCETESRRMPPRRSDSSLKHGLAAPRLGAEALDAEGEGPPRDCRRLSSASSRPAARDGQADDSGRLLAGARRHVAQRRARQRVRLGSAERALGESVRGDVELALVDSGRRLAPRRAVQLALVRRRRRPRPRCRSAPRRVGRPIRRRPRSVPHSDEELGGAEEKGGRALAVAQQALARMHTGDQLPVTKATRK